MKTILFLSLSFFILFGSSCSKEKKGIYTLVKTGKSLSFPLDARTKNTILYLAPYTDKDEREYLTFQNWINNEFWFYDMNTCRPVFKLDPPEEGPDGVGEILGCHIQNFDSMYVTGRGFRQIALIDTALHVKKRIRYEKAHDGTPLSYFCFVTHYYQQATVIGRKMYMYSSPDRHAEKNPVAIVMDMDTEVIEALPFQYPKYPGDLHPQKRYGVEDCFSRCFDGERFIYSFSFVENVYVANPAHDSVYQVSIKSKYIPQVGILNDMVGTAEMLCENPDYGNMLYDPYREVYYRIAYPRTEMDKGVRAMELLMYGRKCFSIIIIDKDFNVLGETLFPDYTYNSKLMFIREDGLYISDSHYMNPAFSDDILSFQRFDLVEKERGE